MSTKSDKLDHELICNLYEELQDIRLVSNKLNQTEYIIDKVLKKHNIIGIRTKNVKVNRLDHQEIINTYLESGRKLSKVTEKYNISGKLITDILNLHNIEKKVIKVSDRMSDQEIIDLYYEILNVKHLSLKIGISTHAIFKVLHKHNINTRHIKTYSDEEIIEKYKEIKSLESVGKIMGISDTRVREALKRHDIDLLRLRRRKIGEINGKLKIIDILPERKKGHRIFLCQCECGNTKVVHNNKMGKIMDCGCVRRERIKIKKEEREKFLLERKLAKEIINEEKSKKGFKRKYFPGQKIGRLTILSSNGTYPNKTFRVICECGTEKTLRYQSILQSKSCGCLQKEKSTIHGMSSKDKKWYDRWRSMIRRCNNIKSKAYKNYGGRGIKVCDRWLEPNGEGCKNYYNDIHNILGVQPSPEHSLDREDNDGMYIISNMRWATNSEQSKNQRRSCDIK